MAGCGVASLSTPGTSQQLSQRDFESIHPEWIDDTREVRALLERLLRERVRMQRGMNRMIVPETAYIAEIVSDEMLLDVENFAETGRSQLFLNFALDSEPYFFAVELLGEETGKQLRCTLPRMVFRAERRDRSRVATLNERVRIWNSREDLGEARVADSSPGGLGLLCDGSWRPERLSRWHVEFVSGGRQGERYSAEVRDVQSEANGGSRRVGMSVSPFPLGSPVPVEERDSIVSLPLSVRAAQRASIAAGLGKVAAGRVARRWLKLDPSLPTPEVVEYCNADGEYLRAIINSYGDTRNAPAIVIPPAWGRTKETLLPLALTILETFRRAKQPVTIIRFDGIRKRGESFNDPECREPGKEHHRFTFSQGVRDIEATLDFLDREERFHPRTSVLVTFSASSIEGRRAVADDGGRRIGAWVSVVGTADMQSMMRVISGGVDYVRGIEHGVEFGLQEILGVVVDIDHAGRDAFSEGLAFLEESRADMARIRVPILWIAGRYDAWMDRARVADALAVGGSSNRRLLDVPTGHQLKTSAEALATFQLIAGEVGQLVAGRPMTPSIPDLSRMEATRLAERKRLPRPSVDLRGFWQDYLLGRDTHLGIELMHETAHYRELMAEQLDALDLQPANTVLDLGAGTGAFPLALAREEARSLPRRIVELDFVPAALERARKRLGETRLAGQTDLEYLECDLVQIGSRRPLLFDSGSFDRVIASLLVSYLDDPGQLLREVRRVLRPDGLFVLSALKPDADISRIYADGVRELEAGVLSGAWAGLDVETVRAAARSFLNDASRLLDLEEDGSFHFHEESELRMMLKDAGFACESVSRVFGSPPQAFVISARRR